MKKNKNNKLNTLLNQNIKSNKTNDTPKKTLTILDKTKVFL